MFSVKKVTYKIRKATYEYSKIDAWVTQQYCFSTVDIAYSLLDF